jgi:hypothetical protein
MLKTVATILMGAIGTSMFTGCVVYRHPHHDDVVVEPAGYRHERVIEHHDRDHDRHDDHSDRDRY